tara:strand:- start:757 stop:1092 length:336 start_codon:yes stop_codon:yes gene_type:complete
MIQFVGFLIIVLICLLILNGVTIKPKPSSSGAPTTSDSSKNFGYYTNKQTCSNMPGCCSLTKFGCCPDGLNSRTDISGTNCPQTYNVGYTPPSSTTTNHNAIPPATIIKPR